MLEIGESFLSSDPSTFDCDEYEKTLSGQPISLCLSYTSCMQPEHCSTHVNLLGDRRKLMENVLVLDIGGNRWGPDQARDILPQWLALLPNLRELDIRDNKLLPRGARILFSMLAQHCRKSLQKLSLNENMIGDEGLLVLEENILPNLVSLNLVTNFITAKGLVSLSKILRSIPQTIEELTLDYNPIGNEGVRILCECLSRQSTPLRLLSLGDCHFGNDACVSLAAYLGSPACQLSELNLSVNRIQVSGMTVLAKGVYQCYSLRSLDLGGNDLGDQSMLEIMVPNLHFFSHLRILDLSCIGMTDPMGYKLAAKMKKLQMLEKGTIIHINGNNLSNDVFQKFCRTDNCSPLKFVPTKLVRTDSRNCSADG